MQVSMDMFIKNFYPLLLNESYTLFIERKKIMLGIELKGGNYTPGTSDISETPKIPANSTAFLPETPASSNSETLMFETLKELKVDVLLTPKASATHYSENDVRTALQRNSQR